MLKRKFDQPNMCINWALPNFRLVRLGFKKTCELYLKLLLPLMAQVLFVRCSVKFICGLFGIHETFVFKIVQQLFDVCLTFIEFLFGLKLRHFSNY
jgi:hypothetical protein